jgi:hypothetical protein
MVDENAFGIWVGYARLEDEEYGSEDTSRFVERVELFRRLVCQFLVDKPLAQAAPVVDFGHALYVELAEDAASGVFTWAKSVRAELAAHDFESTVVVTYGGRWVDPSREASAQPSWEPLGELRLCRFAGPSEPLRRALFAETASHGAPDEESAWGPALYLDTDAAEALGIRPKNEPTRLSVAGATFYRASR